MRLSLSHTEPLIVWCSAVRCGTVTAVGDARDARVAYGCGTKSSESSFWRVVYNKARYDVRNRVFFVYRTAGLRTVDFAHASGMACFRGF